MAASSVISCLACWCCATRQHAGLEAIRPTCDFTSQFSVVCVKDCRTHTLQRQRSKCSTYSVFSPQLQIQPLHDALRHLL
jgi:hypothetical protein